MRLFSAQQEATLQKAVQTAPGGAQATQSWVLPLCGMLTMVAFVAGAGAAARYRVRRSTRQVRSLTAEEDGHMLEVGGPME